MITLFTCCNVGRSKSDGDEIFADAEAKAEAVFSPRRQYECDVTETVAVMHMVGHMAWHAWAAELQSRRAECMSPWTVEET